MNKQVDKSLDIPLYTQVENILMKLLEEEPYKNGFYLPNEVELMKRFSVSRHTLRKAMDNLVMRGLITREKGRGTKLNIEKRRVKTTLNYWRSFTDEMFSKGASIQHIDKTIKMKKVTDEIKEIFELDEKEIKLPMLSRKSGKNNEIEIYFESYFNPKLGLDKDKEFMEGKFTKLYEYLEKNYGIFTTVSDEEIIAMMPTKDLKKILSIINDKTPVLCRKRTVYDRNNMKVEFNIGYYRADRFSYNIRLNNE